MSKKCPPDARVFAPDGKHDILALVVVVDPAVVVTNTS
jgi:hypothetical protein